MHSMKRAWSITVWVIISMVTVIRCGNRFATGEPAQIDNDLGKQARGPVIHLKAQPVPVKGTGAVDEPLVTVWFWAETCPLRMHPQRQSSKSVFPMSWFGEIKLHRPRGE